MSGRQELRVLSVAYIDEKLKLAIQLQSSWVELRDLAVWAYNLDTYARIDPVKAARFEKLHTQISQTLPALTDEFTKSPIKISGGQPILEALAQSSRLSGFRGLHYFFDDFEEAWNNGKLLIDGLIGYLQNLKQDVKAPLPVQELSTEKMAILDNLPIPSAIRESFANFKKLHSDSKKTGFIMMKFENTSAHNKILTAIRDTSRKLGLEALRSDDREYHKDLFSNVETYMWGCGFGIAVYDRIEEEEFSPNVSLETGYMLALRKPVCLLKDKTLQTLHADLLGKLYKPFDPQAPEKTIPNELSKWLYDNGLAKNRI